MQEAGVPIGVGNGKRWTQRRVMSVALGSMIVLVNLATGQKQPVYGKSQEIHRAGTIATGDVTLQGSELGGGESQGVIVQAQGLAPAVSGEARYISPIVMAPLPFTHFGLIWQAIAGDEQTMQLEVRTSRDRQVWTDWQSVTPDDDIAHPGDPNIPSRLITAPWRNGLHQYLQYRVSFHTSENNSAPRLTRVRLAFIDSSQGPSLSSILAKKKAQRASQPQDLTTIAKPDVISRVEWGCPDGENSPLYPPEYASVTHMVVHHTVQSNDPNSDWAADVRSDWTYHTYTQGWGDIGYNYLVDPLGNLYEGRAGGDDVIGVHTGNPFNANNMALAFIGTYGNTPDAVPPPAAMLNSATALFSWKADQKSIDPLGSSWLGGNDPDAKILPNIFGHRDAWGTTACPGDYLYSDIPGLRQSVADQLDTSAITLEDNDPVVFSRNSEYWWDGPAGCGSGGHALYTLSVISPVNSTNWGIWRPNLVRTSTYRVSAFIPNCSISDADTQGVTYTIHSADGDVTQHISQSDARGTWVSLGSYRFNAGTDGYVRLTDLADDSGRKVWFDAVRFSDSAPVAASNLAPADNSWLDSGTVHFSWTSVTGGLSYRLKVATDSGMNHMVLNQEGLTSTTTDQTFDPLYTDLYWTVETDTGNGYANASTPTHFSILVRPTAITPITGAWLPNSAVAFSWTTASTGAAYILRVATDSGMQNTILTVSNIAGTSTTASINQPNTILYWTVEGTANGHSSGTSTATTFGLDTIAPVSTVPAIYYTVDHRYLVTWSGSDDHSGIATYTVEYRNEAIGSWVAWLTDTTQTSAAFNAIGGATYWFRVRATDAAGNQEPVHAGPGDMSTRQAITMSYGVYLPAVQR